MNPSTTKLPLLVSLFCVIAGLLVGMVSGSGGATVVAVVIAGFAIVPACYALWSGMSHSTQHAVVWSILLIIASLGVAGLLIVRHVVEWFR